jgi:hypothetical protein
MIGKTSRNLRAERKARMDKQVLFSLFHGEQDLIRDPWLFGRRMYAKMGVHDPEDGLESPESTFHAGPGTGQAYGIRRRRLGNRLGHSLPGVLDYFPEKAG